MKISLIVAVYNRDESILRALNSIKSQTYKDIEIVVIDGASSDNTVEIAKSVLSDNDIFISEKDRGIYDALNKGIKNSSGDVIGFLHSDDLYYDNNVISKIHDFFYKDRSLDIVFGNATFFKKGMINKIIRNYQSDNLSIKNLAWGKMPAHTAMFFRKKLFQNYGMFNIKYKICGDYEFICRIMATKNINSIYIPETFIKMQIGGLSTRGLTSAITVNKETLMACRDNGIYTNIFMIMSKYPSKIMQLIYKES